MAVPTGSGTETLHSHWFNDVDGAQTLIFGAQYQETESLGSGLAYIVLSSTLGTSGSRSLSTADYKFVGEMQHDMVRKQRPSDRISR